MTRLRDNSYWIDPASTRTSATSNTLVLTPDTTAGTTQWQEIGSLLDKTKGIVTAMPQAYTTLTSLSAGLLFFNYHQTFGTDGSSAGSLKIDLSDDSFVSSYFTFTINGVPQSSNGYSGTITTGSTVGVCWNVFATEQVIEFRRDSGNLQYRSPTQNVSGLYADWIVL